MVEFENRHRVDALVRQFARKLRWPKLSPVERAFIHYRLDAAERFLQVLASQPVCPPPDQGFERTVVWLLNHHWDQRGHWEWVMFNEYSSRPRATPAGLPMPERPEDGFAV